MFGMVFFSLTEEGLALSMSKNASKEIYSEPPEINGGRKSVVHVTKNLGDTLKLIFYQNNQ